MNIQWHGVIATVLVWCGVLTCLGAVALFLTGRFGALPLESAGTSHDSRYLVLKPALRLGLLIMPLAAGLLLAAAGIILRKQILLVQRQFELRTDDN